MEDCITLYGSKYYRDKDGWFGVETSTGTYGCIPVDGRWCPAFLDDHGIEAWDELYDTPEEAIDKALSAWS